MQKLYHLEYSLWITVPRNSVLYSFLLNFLYPAKRKRWETIITDYSTYIQLFFSIDRFLEFLQVCIGLRSYNVQTPVAVRPPTLSKVESVRRWVTSWKYQMLYAWICWLRNNSSDLEIAEPSYETEYEKKMLYSFTFKKTLVKVWFYLFSLQLWIN